MSELFSDEFLSAYLDGELSPHERAAVERWIERAPEARQRLEDFRGLSRLFGDLSRTELPREFPTEVMHLAERRMLLPDPAAARGRMRIRGWTLALAATATAAGLLLTLTIFNVDDRAPGARGVVRNNPPGPAPELATAAKPAATREPTNVQIAQDERSSRSTDLPRAGVRSGAMPPAAAAGGAASAVAPAVGAASSKTKASDSLLSAKVDSDRQLQAIHAAVQEIRESGTADKYLLVVRARAVDWADGLVLLQQDFADNNILVDARDAGKLQPVADDKPRGEASSEGLYIEADADAVIAGFKTTLARRHPGVQFVVEPSIELAALDQEWQRNLLRSGVERAASDFSRGDDAAKGSKDADAKANKKSSQPAVSRKSPLPTSRAAQLPGGKGMIEERSASVPPPGKNDKVPNENESPAGPEENQTTNNARQMVISNLPQAIQNRARSSGDTNSAAAKGDSSKGDSRGLKEQASGDGEKPHGQKGSDEKSRDTKSDREKSRDDSPVGKKSGDGKFGDAKPLSADQQKSDGRSPVLVRILIVFEGEPQQPAAPADKKGPSGGAS